MPHVFAAVNVTTPALHTTTVAGRTGLYRRTGGSKTRRLQRTFAGRPRRVAAGDPAGRHPRVVRIIDHAPWHRGRPVDEARAANPHLERYRLPSDSPQLDVIERFGKILRRRATHNRLFDTPADRKRSVRNRVRYFQTVRSRIRTLIANRYPTQINQTPTSRPSGIPLCSTDRTASTLSIQRIHW